MKKSGLKYAEALQKLEDIVKAIDNNSLELDELVKNIKEANELISFCKDKLAHADHEIEKIWAQKKENE